MMKLFLKTFVIVTIVVSCTAKKTETVTNKEVKVEEVSVSQVDQVLQEYMIAWAEHDVQKIGNFFAKNAQWYNLPTDTVIKGKESVTKAITGAFMGNIPDMYWAKNGDVFISENTITYEWVYGGTFNGKWGDLHINNKRFSIKGISTTTINEEGKIIAQKDYYDFYGLQKQLGVLK